jgi:hypothetical protein
VAESLGEALLVLRTDDGAFNSGVQQAEGKAQRLGAQLDKTKGSSAQLAAEMQRTGQGVLVLGRNYEIAGQKVIASAGAQRQGMQQLGYQLGDIATMYSLGARPAQIFASQIGQVTQAVQLMGGGTSRVAAFLGGPWGIALSVGVIALSPFIAKLFEAEDALKGVEFASDRLGDAQGILGRVIDETTGKVNAQSQAMLALARAQAAAGMVGAMQRQAAARSELQSIGQGGLGDLRVEGTMGGLRLTRDENGSRIVELFRSGRLTGAAAEQQLRARMESGLISREAYFRAAQAITSFDVEGANVAVFKDTLAGLDGDSAAALRVLGPTGSPRGRGGRPAAGQATIDARFESDLIAITQRILQARMQIATTAEERAELAARGVEWDRREALAAIAAREGLDDAQRAELEAAANRLADIELEAIEFTKRRELARDAQALADERFRGEAEALQIAGDLADTEAERRDIALRLYDAQVAMERLALQTVVDMAARGEIEKREGELAAQRLANLNANAGAGRAAVARQNETEAERYLRGVNATSGQINEALDGIRIDGLESLNDGLTRAIMGAESLGDVFSRVADQIIADLLRIAIQQAIIRPLANSLFGGMGGGDGGGGLGSLFAGFFATGGTIPTGQFGIVGEEGPEIAYAGPGGLGILSNSDSRKMIGGAGGGTNVTIPISIDATGADPAAIARLNTKLDQLRNELPGTIVTTVQDASDRRIINIGGGR